MVITPFEMCPVNQNTIMTDTCNHTIKKIHEQGLP